MRLEHRMLEKELMEGEEAEAYAGSDFSIPHNAFVDHFIELFPDFTEGLVADVGCGSCGPTIRLAKKLQGLTITGIDGSDKMLELARKAIDKEGLVDRVRLIKRILPDITGLSGIFDAVISNSWLHQVHEVEKALPTMAELAKRGAILMGMDLFRPVSTERAHELVAMHAKGAPEQMKVDFYNSLLAALTPTELVAKLKKAGLGHLAVEVVSDRHMIFYGRR
jgi:ubiquinone/menaquinone biosynthesis C-methylase UbiE